MNLDSMMLYKLMILHMLSSVNFPMTKIQITEFFVSRRYARVEEVQQALSELNDSQLIDMEVTYNSSRYSIKQDGISTLSYFMENVSDAIVEEIDAYMKENKIKLRDDSNTIAQYYQLPSENYVVECKVNEGNDTLIKLELLVPEKEQAEKMSANWKKCSDEIFRHIMLKLFSD